MLQRLTWLWLLRLLICFPSTLARPSGQHTTDFPPGWNGMARMPPMGWRSWNAFGARINHSIIETNMAAITDKRLKVHGREEPASLADLGYVNFGIDEVRARVRARARARVRV